MINTNQLKENTYCNSASYDGIYHTRQITDFLNNIVPWINKHYIAPNIYFFSNMLNISLQANFYNTSIPYQVRTNDVCTDCRDLNINVSVKNVNNYFVLCEITQQYKFTYTSSRHVYPVGSTETFRRVNCRCIQSSPSTNEYVFETDVHNVFHFTFHTPDRKKKPNEKFKGAFHVKIDSLIKYQKIVPYRAYIYDIEQNTPTPQFVVWDDLDGRLKGYFADTDPRLDHFEIATFLARYPGTPLVFPDHHGKMVHYIDDIVQPIYDRIVKKTLNRILRHSWYSVNPMSTVTIPVAIKYDPTKDVVDCSGLKLARNDPQLQTFMTINHHPREVLYGGEKTRKQYRRRKK